MKVINICHADFANFAYHNAKAMESVGIEAECMVLKPHSFYKERAKVYTIEQIKQAINEADVVQVMHSCGTMWDLVKDLNKRVFVWHTGTRYRQDPAKHNARWNSVAEKVIIALGEFQNLGAKNPIYFGITINTDEITPDYTMCEKLRIAHFPSNPTVKGTDTIKEVVKNLVKICYPFKFDYSPLIVSHEKQLKRMNNCDIYIEMCAPLQNDKPYGSYGTTAVEAAALGKIVITNNLWQDLYTKSYGDCALEIANTASELFFKIEELLTLNRNDLLMLKMTSRRWAEEKHSYRSTGERMLKLLND